MDSLRVDRFADDDHRRDRDRERERPDDGAPRIEEGGTPLVVRETVVPEPGSARIRDFTGVSSA